MINFSDKRGFLKLCPNLGPTSIFDGRGKPNFPSSTRVKGIKTLVGSTLVISKGTPVTSVTRVNRQAGMRQCLGCKASQHTSQPGFLFNP